MQFMSKSKELRDIFEPEKKEEILKSQGDYIDILKEMSSRMIVLQGQDEINALPDLHTLIEFLQQLLSVNFDH
jgi:hypothetical protein